MATATVNPTDCTQLDSLLLERVKYFPRQLLTADDMTADQDYFLAKLRRHNRYLHGWGVVCGLQVSVAATQSNPWQVQIGSGYALGPYGDEIYVPNPVFLDLAQCGAGAQTDPCDPGVLLQGSVTKTGATIFIAIRYEECYARPVRVLPGGCGCNDTSCETSRISDSYEIECLTSMPASNQVQPGPSVCDILNGQALSQCPVCPPDPWIVLAQVVLPGSSSVPIPQSLVNNFVRRQLFSTAALQQQVILCCCGDTGKKPAEVTSINPAQDSNFVDATTVPPSVIVTFDKHLQAQTVNTNSFQVVRVVTGKPSVILQGQVTYDDGHMSAQFLPAQALTVPGEYLVTIVGSGPNAIMDADNLALDGNADGIPGGNFISQFTVSVVAPTPTPTPTALRVPSPNTPAVTAQVENPGQVPQVPLNNTAVEVSDLVLAISGGTPGQIVTADLVVNFSLNVGSSSPTDSAQLTDMSGNLITATKSASAYTFSGVSITGPTPGAAAPTIRITNMKADTTKVPTNPAGAPLATTVTAFVSCPNGALLVTSPTQTVAQLP